MVIRSSLLSSYISGLSDELLVEIFCRLGSSKYATRCKSICKRWYSLINGPYSCDSYFLRRWRQIHPEEEQPIALLTQFQLFPNFGDYRGAEIPHVVDYFPEFNKELPTFNSLDFLPCYTGDIENPICVLATFKDLVLCCPGKEDHSVYYICNPFTKQWIVLPRPLPLPLPPGYPKINILVGLVVSDDDNGYGNDLKFKVVRVLETISRTRNVEMVYLEIFSSDDSSCTWKRKESSVPKQPFSLGVISYHGILIRHSIFSGADRFIGFKFHIDDDHDNVNHICLPRPPYERSFIGSGIGVCKGCLRVGQLTITDPTTFNNTNIIVHKLIIWEFDCHRQAWDLVHELDLSEFEFTEDTSSIFSRFWLGDILGFHPRDKDILYLGYSLYDISVTCSCNVGKRTIEIIREFPKRSLQGNVFPLQLPSWPTPVPLLRCSPELQKQS